MMEYIWKNVWKNIWVLGLVLVTLSMVTLPIMTKIMGAIGIVLIVVSVLNWND
jgi:hypothetical protein